MTLRPLLAALGLLVLAPTAPAQPAANPASPLPEAVAPASVDPALRQKVLEQARTAGQLAAVMLKCNIRPNALQAQSLVDYRLTVVSLGAEAGLSESEVDDVADAARDSTMDRLPEKPPAALCEAGRMRVAAIAQAYGLFQLRPPAPEPAPESSAEPAPADSGRAPD